MSDPKTGNGEVPAGSLGGGVGSPASRYEAPTLTLVGNARDLLAGGTGTVADMPPTIKPTQASG
jgi:hypothetical protein